MENIFDDIIKNAKKIKGKTLAFPEGDDPRILEAVKKILDEKLAKVVVFGNETVLCKIYSNLSDVTIIDPTKKCDLRSKLVENLYEIRKHKGLTIDEADSIISISIYYACMMLKLDMVDGVVAGAVYHSKDVMKPAFQIIKQKPNIKVASSFFIMEVPESRASKIGENGCVVFSDCGTVQYPSAEELSSIAISSRDSAKYVCGLKPRISFLSYSTASKNSDDPTILKTLKAIELFKKQDSVTIVDGEMQGDSALDPVVCKQKYPNSRVKGKANVLIFPDINAGNISYKLVHEFTGLRAVGPILQGLNKPVNDLSRGATADEIYLVSAITLLQTKIK